MTTIYSVTETSSYIKSLVSKGKKVRVQGEVSQPKLSNGNLYFSLKDNQSNIKAIVWKFKNVDKSSIQQGTVIICDGTLDYYGIGSTINLIVDSVEISMERGDIMAEFEKNKKEFEMKGYFAKERKKPLPNLITNILIYTSTEAGIVINDFIYNLMHNNMKINYTVEHVAVQGVDCPKDIINKLMNYNMESNYDMIVIIRGGGSFEDLYGFSQSELVESIYSFMGPPILSAIGHMVDCPLIDSISDASAPTPSLAGQFIVDHNNKYIMGLRKTVDCIKFDIIQHIENKNKQITSYYNKLQYVVQNKMQGIKYNMYEKIKDTIHSDMLQLNRMEEKLNSHMVPQITIYNMDNMTKVENENMIHPNTIYCMRWKNKEWKVKIMENNLEE